MGLDARTREEGYLDGIAMTEDAADDPTPPERRRYGFLRCALIFRLTVMVALSACGASPTVVHPAGQVVDPPPQRVRLEFVLAVHAGAGAPERDLPSDQRAAYVAALAGCASGLPGNLDGQDVWETLSGSADSQRPRPIYIKARSGSSLRLGDWKLVQLDSGEVQLFNLAEDPVEETDLAGDQPERLEELLSLLKRQQEKDGEPTFLEERDQAESAGDL